MERRTDHNTGAMICGSEPVPALTIKLSDQPKPKK